MSETLDTTAPLEGAVVEKVATATVEGVAPEVIAETAKPVAAVKEKLVKIKFLLSPTGLFKLGYNVGEKASLPALQAQEIVDAGYAELVK